MLYLGEINLWVAILFTIIINFILWLIGPAITDLINKWFYRVRFLSKEELEREYPEVKEIIERVSLKYKFKFPKVGIIPDKNPTAFTYGSGRFNARIILTDGIFYFLNQKERQAVIAHELGHIVNRDFIIMMIGSTLVQILYQIYAYLSRTRSRKRGEIKLILAFCAYILYLIGIYLLFYLSRTREYLADAFSAKTTDPQSLSNALIKIAYGIVKIKDTDRTQHLLKSTRHLGIIDVKNAKHTVTSFIASKDREVISEVIAFDKVSPWAKLVELSSTHPLTGNRISYLSEIAKKQGKPFSFDVSSAIKRMNIDKNKLYKDFLFGLFILLLPYLLAFSAFFFLPLAFLPAAFGIGLILQTLYKFPLSPPFKTTVLEQMRDPYASPLRGKPVTISGKVIGRGIPGFIFGEDMMYQDSTGLIFLNYSSLFGFIGDLFFALTKLKKLFGLPSQATGWFYRGIGSSISLRYLETEKEKIKSYPFLWSLLRPIILIIISIFLYYIIGSFHLVDLLGL